MTDPWDRELLIYILRDDLTEMRGCSVMLVPHLTVVAEDLPSSEIVTGENT
jgi:hypothetical protein